MLPIFKNISYYYILHLIFYLVFDIFLLFSQNKVHIFIKFKLITVSC